MTKSPRRVLALGEVLWDVYPNRRSLGGAPLNFACACAGLGAEARIASRVGADDSGRDLREVLARLPVDVSLLQTDETRPTGEVLVTLDETGTPNYRIVDGVAWDALECTEDVRREGARADIVYFGTLAKRSHGARTAIAQALECVAADALRVCDVNLRMNYFSAELLRVCMLQASLVKFTMTELATTARLLDLPARPEDFAAEVMTRFGVRCVVATDGPRGASAWTVNESARVPGLAVDVVDTLGTGDAFLASFVMKFSEGAPLREALAFGNVSGAFAATRAGALLTFAASDIANIARAYAKPRAAMAEVDSHD